MQVEAQKILFKIFKKKSNPRSSKLLPFYVIDLLGKNAIENQPPITAKEIQKTLVRENKGWHDLRQIYITINNMHHYYTGAQLEVHKIRIGDTKATAIKLKK